MSTKVRHSPKQERSRKTREALLDACERLLKNKPWRGISIQQIVVEAGLSNGAVYGRFKNKDEILVALYERHNEQLKSRYSGKLAKVPDPDVDLLQQLSHEVDQLIKNYVNNRWLLREMSLLSRIKPEVVTTDMRKDRKTILDGTAKRYAPLLPQQLHPSPMRTMEMIIFFVSTILREVILYPGPHCDSLKIKRRELKQFLTLMVTGMTSSNHFSNS